jgi:hypothetical protein
MFGEPKCDIVAVTNPDLPVGDTNAKKVGIATLRVEKSF